MVIQTEGSSRHLRVLVAVMILMSHPLVNSSPRNDCMPMRSVLLFWQLWALLSAVFAALAAIFAKIGVENEHGNNFCETSNVRSDGFRLCTSVSSDEQLQRIKSVASCCIFVDTRDVWRI